MLIYPLALPKLNFTPFHTDPNADLPPNILLMFYFRNIFGHSNLSWMVEAMCCYWFDWNSSKVTITKSFCSPNPRAISILSLGPQGRTKKNEPIRIEWRKDQSEWRIVTIKCVTSMSCDKMVTKRHANVHSHLLIPKSWIPKPDW